MPKSRTKVPRTMAPAWRRILMKHQGAVLGEFRRDPKIEEKISGIVLAFSDEFLLLRRMHWDIFRGNLVNTLAKAGLFFGGGVLDEIASAFSPEESELLHGWSPIPDHNRSP